MNATAQRLLGLVIVLIVALVVLTIVSAALIRERNEEPSVDVQLYVMAVDDGADVEQYKVEQAGDQFTYQISEHVLQNIQQTPYFAQCIDGLSITSVWTPFAETACSNSLHPQVHVVLIAPY